MLFFRKLPKNQTVAGKIAELADIRSKTEPEILGIYKFTILFTNLTSLMKNS